MGLWEVWASLSRWHRRGAIVGIGSAVAAAAWHVDAHILRPAEYQEYWQEERDRKRAEELQYLLKPERRAPAAAAAAPAAQAPAAAQPMPAPAQLPSAAAQSQALAGAAAPAAVPGAADVQGQPQPRRGWFGWLWRRGGSQPS